MPNKKANRRYEIVLALKNLKESMEANLRKIQQASDVGTIKEATKAIDILFNKESDLIKKAKAAESPSLNTLIEKIEQINKKANKFRGAVEKTEAQLKAPVASSTKEILLGIKDYVEITHFMVGDYIGYKGGRTVEMKPSNLKPWDTRLPHRVADIYEILQKEETGDQEKLKNIHNIAKEAVNNPRHRRDEYTHRFYYNIYSNPEWFVKPKSDNNEEGADIKPSI
jgi:hypothetical protein